MKNTFKIAVIISIAIHSALIIGAAWWQARASMGLGGGGGGVVEVAIAGGAGREYASVSARRNLSPTPIVGWEKGAGSGDGIGAKSGFSDSRLVAIWTKINQSKYYPEIARSSRLEGSPKISFSITPDGGVRQIKLAQTCGSDILDLAALETIKRSAPLPFYPDSLMITVKYSLNPAY